MTETATQVEVGLLRIETDETMFPLYVAIGEGTKIDTSKLSKPISYIVTGRGLMVYRDTGVFETLALAQDGVAGLPEPESSLHLSLSKIPKEITHKVLSFFRWASQERNSEAIVLPYYNQSTNEWLMVCPEQQASLGNVDYSQPAPNTIPDGFSRIGTWHSHGYMSAFHSGTDLHDEHKDDGIHITSGNVSRSNPSVVVSAAMFSTRWALAPENFFEGTVSYKKGRVEEETSLELGEIEDEFPKEWKGKHTKVFAQQFGFGGQGGASTSRAPMATIETCFSCIFNLSNYEHARVKAYVEKAGDRLKENMLSFAKDGTIQLVVDKEIAELVLESGMGAGTSVVAKALMYKFDPATQRRMDKFENDVDTTGSICLAPHGVRYAKRNTKRKAVLNDTTACPVYQPAVYTMRTVEDILERYEKRYYEYRSARGEVTCGDCEKFWAIMATQPTTELCESFLDKLGPVTELDLIESAYSDITARDCKEFEPYE